MFGATLRFSFALVCALCIWLGFSSPVEAQNSREQRVEAAQRFDRGVRLYRERNYQAALAEFLRAHEIAPVYHVLYNIGKVYSFLHRYPEARQAFERYLEEGGGRINPSRRAEVEGELARLAELVSSVRIVVEGGEDALVLLDGNEVGRAPFSEPFQISAGDHVIEARAEGFHPSRREVTVAGGVEVSITLTLLRVETPGAIVVSTNVPSAQIFVDDQEVGTSPLGDAVPAPPGRHVVRASRPGYDDARLEVEVLENDVVTAELSLAPLETLPPGLSGAIELRVNEELYEALLDGAPYAGGPVPSGAHTLTVRRAGFEEFSRTVDVAAAETAAVEVTLVPTTEFVERYREGANRLRIAAWVTAGLGVAILGTTLGLYIWNNGRDGEWQNTASVLEAELALPVGERSMSEEEIERSYDEAQELGRELQSWSIAEWALFGVGVAAVTASIVLFSVGPNPNRYSMVSVSPAPGGGSIAFAW